MYIRVRSYSSQSVYMDYTDFGWAGFEPDIAV
jgi:hypothetical protein